MFASNKATKLLGLGNYLITALLSVSVIASNTPKQMVLAKGLGRHLFLTYISGLPRQ